MIAPMYISITCQPDPDGHMPSANYRDPEGFVSLTLDEGRRSITALTERPEYLIAMAYQSLSGVADLTAPGGRPLTEEHRDALEGCVPPDRRLAAPGRARP